jgi:hypothetical protein
VFRVTTIKEFAFAFELHGVVGVIAGVKGDQHEDGVVRHRPLLSGISSMTGLTQHWSEWFAVSTRLREWR